MSLSTIESVGLIRKYKDTGDVSVRNQIILKYGELVRYIAVSMRNMYVKYADVEDVVNEGIIALISALDSFDESRNVKFETYASIRIRGGIIDFIRKQDFIPRNIRKFAKDADATFSDLYSKLGREPTDNEIATQMGIDEKKYKHLMGKSACLTTLSFEELIFENKFEMSDDGTSSEWSAEKDLLGAERKEVLLDTINNLKEKEKQVISLYYYEKLKFSEIAQVLDISESRVCQIHSQAIAKLRNSLGD